MSPVVFIANIIHFMSVCAYLKLSPPLSKPWYIQLKSIWSIHCNDCEYIGFIRLPLLSLWFQYSVCLIHMHIGQFYQNVYSEKKDLFTFFCDNKYRVYICVPFEKQYRATILVWTIVCLALIEGYLV